MTVKETVLSCLEQNRGEIISGQQLADTAQVSRSAVWKAIHQLTQEGHQITVLPHKGYRLEQDSDRLSAQAIRQALDSPYRDIPLFLFDTIDSTNQEANRRLLDQAQHRTVILSEEQTQGRGRLGRSFYSPPSTGLYFSAILKPNLPLEQVGCLTVAAANAVCRGLEELGVEQPGIKWVNDIYVNGKKVFEDGKVISIQDYIAEETLRKYDTVDINVYEANLFHTKMMLKDINLQNYLFNTDVYELPPRVRLEIMDSIRREMIEIYSGRNIY